MLKIEIPGFGLLKLEHLVSDFTGTLSVDGRLCLGVKERLGSISKILKIHILTSDTFGTARRELEGIECTIHILEGKNHDVQKEIYLKNLGGELLPWVTEGTTGECSRSQGLGLRSLKGRVAQPMP